MQTLIVCLLLSVGICNGTSWPVPYRRYDNRPPTDPFCQAKYTFCPTGLTPNQMPLFDPNDIVEVFAMQAPVWEFLYGNMMAKLNVWHDAIGFRSRRTGINYTMEWYELFQLLNCTFPHLLQGAGGGELRWCNQGAACIYRGINDIHWTQNGTLIKVGEMSGEQFSEFSLWALWDNRTGIFYETWKVEEKPDGQVWFESYDCASFVLRAYDKMGAIGVKFNHSISLNYTRIHLYSEEPILLGNMSVIRANSTLYADIMEFYEIFQPQSGVLNFLEHLIEALIDISLLKQFYVYYNDEYWYLRLKSPFVGLTYKNVPLP